MFYTFYCIYCIYNSYNFILISALINITVAMKRIALIFLVIFYVLQLHAQSSFISDKTKDAFIVTDQNNTASIYIDASDNILTQKAAAFLQDDISKVCGKTPSIINNIDSAHQDIIIIGTYNQSAIIQQLIQDKKLKADSIQNKWEA